MLAKIKKKAESTKLPAHFSGKRWIHRIYITQQYTNTEAAVGCIKAGVDIVLGPLVFTEAFDAVVKAVEDGTITEQRIDESVRRILKLKQSISR